MPTQTAADFHPEVLQLFDRYVHGDLSRRGFLDLASRHAGSAAGAAALLAALSPQFAQAQQIAPTDARIRTRKVEINTPQGSGKMNAYMAMPAQASGRLPAVLVIHENRGLNPHIEDITRRLALDGFVALAPDALTGLGGYPGDEDTARAQFAKLDQSKIREDFIATYAWLKGAPEANGQVASIGFCYGGGIVNFLATRLPDMAGGVPFYGPAPAAADAARIKSPLQIHYAGDDERINAGWPAYEAALKAAAVPHQAFIYPGKQHGFNNDTTPRFDKAAAALAWQRSVDFLREHAKA